MNLDAYSISHKFFRRGPCIVAQSGNVLAPVCYLRRPQWLAEADFRAICAAIRLDLPAGYELKGRAK